MENNGYEDYCDEDETQDGTCERAQHDVEHVERGVWGGGWKGAGKEVGGSNMPVVATIVEGGRGETVGLEMSVGWDQGGEWDQGGG